MYKFLKIVYRNHREANWANVSVRAEFGEDRFKRIYDIQGNMIANLDLAEIASIAVDSGSGPETVYRHPLE